MTKPILTILFFCFMLIYSVRISEGAINRIFIAFDGTDSYEAYIHDSILKAQQFLGDRKLRRQKNDEVFVAVIKNDIIPVFDGKLDKDILLMKFLEDTKMFKNKNKVVNLNAILQQAKIFYERPSGEEVNKIFILFSDCLESGMPGSRNSVIANIGQGEIQSLKDLDEGYMLYIDSKAQEEYINTFNQEGLHNIIFKSPTAMASGYTIPIPLYHITPQGGVGRLFKVFFVVVAIFFIVIVGIGILQRRRSLVNTDKKDSSIFPESP